MAHKFGGQWTEVKLSILRDYLNFYTTALKNKYFDLIYIDAFAGTGEREQKIEAAPILNEEEEIQIKAGSVRIALETTPPFSSYHFIEKKPSHVERLKQVIAEPKYKDLKINVYQGDANEKLQEIISQQFQQKNKRAVLFLDPYGLSVEWKVLEAINSTQRVDVWFLFSLSGLYRNASLDFEKIEDYKKECINQIFGSAEWQRIFYTNEYQPAQGDLFGLAPTTTNKINRTAAVPELEAYVYQRLSSLFHYVEKPVALPRIGGQLFSLFLCVSNPNEKAVALARKVAQHIIQKNH